MLENLGSQTSGCCCNIAACWNYNKRAKKKEKEKRNMPALQQTMVFTCGLTLSLKLLKYVV